MIRKYNKLEKGNRFKAKRSGEIYRVNQVRILVFRGNLVLKVVKPKSRITCVLREISICPGNSSNKLGLLLKEKEDCRYPKDSRIFKQGFNIVDNRGRLRVSWKESLYLVEDD